MWIISLVLLLFWASLFVLVLVALGSIFQSRSNSPGGLEELLLNLILGLSIVVFLGYILARFHIGLNNLGSITLLFLTVDGAFSLFRKKDIRWFSLIRKNFKQAWQILLISVLTISIPYMKLSQRGHLLPVFSRGNNDLGTFVLESEALLQSGFKNTGFFANSDIADYASKNDFGFPSILAWASSFPKLSSWSAVSPVVLVLVFVIALSLCVLTTAVFKNYDIPILAVSAIAICNAPLLYLVSNHFLPQLLCMGFIFAICSFLMSYSKANQNPPVNLFKLAFISSAVFYCYPFMYIFVLGLVASRLLIALIDARFRFRLSHHNLRQQYPLRILLAFLFSLLTCYPFAPNAIKRIRDISSLPMGWPMPRPPSILSLVHVADFASTLFSGRETLILSLLLMLFIIQLFFWIKKRKDLDEVFVCFAYILAPIALWFTSGYLIGFDAYKTWKLLFFFAPLYFCFLAALYSIIYGKTTIYFLIGLLSMSMIPTWFPVFDRPTDPRFTSSQDLYDLNQSGYLKSLNQINIDLTPYWESMLAAAIVPSEVKNISSDSYFPPMANSETCTLVRIDNPIVNSYENSKILINNSYALIPIQTDCK